MTEYFIKLKSGGRMLEISPSGVCKLVEGGLGGFDFAGFDVKITPYSVRSGGYAKKRRFAERELSIVFEISSLGEVASTLRRRIVSMLDPRADCEIEIELCGVSRRITAIPYGEARFVQPTFADYTVVELNFIAPDVFFADTKSTVIKFRDAAPILTFPLNFMAGAGTVSGIYRSLDRANVRNKGDGECGVVATVRARGGEVTSPMIKCGDKFVKCNITLADGDTLVIDTRERLKNIYLNGERFFSFDRNSVFFSLPAGESDFSVTADSGGEFIDAEIEFTPIYFGV